MPTSRGVRWLKPISTLRPLAPISPRKSWLLRVQPDDSIAAPAMVKHTKEVSDVQIEKGSPGLLKIVNVGAK